MRRTEDDLIRRTRRIVVTGVALLAFGLVGSFVWWRLHFMAQTALAVERFRLANDRLPKDLSELVPHFLHAVPRDPFDGAPLRYKPLDKGYVIYSIGPDGHDDGGKEPTLRRRGSEHVPEDITMTVER